MLDFLSLSFSCSADSNLCSRLVSLDSSSSTLYVKPAFSSFTLSHSSLKVASFFFNPLISSSKSLLFTVYHASWLSFSSIDLSLASMVDLISWICLCRIILVSLCLSIASLQSSNVAESLFFSLTTRWRSCCIAVVFFWSFMSSLFKSSLSCSKACNFISNSEFSRFKRKSSLSISSFLFCIFSKLLFVPDKSSLRT